MLIKKSEAKTMQNSPDCTVCEYAYPSENFSAATALINGRYPASQRVTNLKCEEIYYVVSGEGTIHSDRGEYHIAQGDVYHFEKGEVYWVEGKELFLVVVNAPKWTSDQHQIVD